MRTYSGRRLDPTRGTGSNTRITVREDQGDAVQMIPLPHIVKHSPTGMQWGYAGSGPSDLALSILAHHFGETAKDVMKYERGMRLMPHCLRFYQQFKFDFVAGWGNEWTVTSEQIDQWIDLRLAPEETKPLGV